MSALPPALSLTRSWFRAALKFRPSRLVVAVVGSLLAHLLVVFGHQIELSMPTDMIQLEARLVRSAPSAKLGKAAKNDAPPKPPVPKPKPKETPQTAQAEGRDPPLQTPPPEAQPEPEQLAQAQPESLPVPEAPPVVGSQWPKTGKITFVIQMGEQRFQMGRSVHQWEVGPDNAYRIQAVTEPTGLAAIPWFKPDSVYWESKGKITELGFQPESFIEQKSLKGITAKGELNWQTKTVTLGGQHSFALIDGSQDMLSLFYQLGYPGVAEVGVLPIITGKRVETYRFEVLGVENLALPFGQTWPALHIRARYGQNEVTEVWTAQEQFGLPVQIRMVDRKGVVYYMVATEVLVDKEAVARRPISGAVVVPGASPGMLPGPIKSDSTTSPAVPVAEVVVTTKPPTERQN